MTHISNLKQIGNRRIITASLLFCSTLAWFYVFHTILLDSILSISGTNVIYVSIGKLLFYGAAVFSGLGGSLISEIAERRRLLFFCVTLGLLSTISLTIVEGLIFSIFLCMPLGASFGLSFPICQSLLTESTKVTSRGRIAGEVIFITFIIVVVILLLTTFLDLRIMELAILCAILNVVSLFSLLITPIHREKGPKKPWSMILRSKTFGSYAIPWLIFNIANGLLSFGRLSDQIESIKIIGTALEFFATIFTALAAGFIADRIGRKQPMMAGLVVLGIGYAFFGLVNSQDSYIVYLIVEGIAWGLIAVIYMQVILGDISANSGSKERYYALGGIMIPFLTRTVFFVGQEISGLTVPANSLSTVLSIITFLSVIPLLRAPETLPESIVRERKLKKHVKDVGELVSKSKKK